MLLYDNFYRRFGVRRPTQLVEPPIGDVTALELPRFSVFHYPGGGPLDNGPVSDELLFKQVTRPIPVWHITELTATDGNPRLLPIQTQQLIRRYHASNRRFRWIKTPDLGYRDTLVPFVYNYAYLHRMYKYVRSLYSEHNRWRNIQSTVWKTIAETVKNSDWNHFIRITLPKTLPGLSDLRVAAEHFDDSLAVTSEDAKFTTALEGFEESVREIIPESTVLRLGEVSLEEMTLRSLKIFNTPEMLMVLELWRWAGEQRDKSFINQVALKDLHRVNLIFEEGGKWCVLNLGKFNEWRKASASDVANDSELTDKGFNPKQAQLYMLRFIMGVFQFKTGAITAVDDGADIVDDEAIGGDETSVTVTTQPVEIPTTQGSGSKSTPVVSTVDNIVTVDNNDTDNGVITSDTEEQVMRDLQTLDDMSSSAAATAASQAVDFETITVNKTPEDAVKAVCDHLAEDGMMSANEYRKYLELSSKYKTILAPNGKVTIDKFIEIPPEVKEIKESKAVPDIPTVVDKTMLKSSLLTFDYTYITKCLEPHVAAMVLGAQQAGICVTDYQKERVNDIMGAYDMYEVRLNPVEGAPSTFRFKLPVIDDDGTYTANGVKYRMRKQRGDLPIRKINPSTVALTSYYGKVFAFRSDKRVNDYGTWINNSIMAKGLDDAESCVSSVNPGNVFDRSYSCPRILSAMMSGFREFTVNRQPTRDGIAFSSIRFILDHAQHDKEFPPEIVKAIKGSNPKFWLVGKTDNHFPVVMDENEALYCFKLPTDGGKEATLATLPSIVELLELDINKAPVEFATLKVLGKTIPMAFVLGYEMGLEGLMKFLKVTPRRVLAGQRTNLAADEYAVVFADETLIFSRDNKFASIVLGGLNEYHRAIRSFNVHEFDRKAVYLNVLESNGLSVRYLREIDLLYRMFIDPITLDLLQHLKEPTTFRGLLVKSCQLLMTDSHPDELDPAYMRIKGYERVPGAVYGEIVKALRVHGGRTGKSKYPVDINPYAVWKTIAQDPSVALVSDINPIENLKAMEAVTYNGVGGRNSRSMTKKTRAYHPNDMGTISEATKDSADVGINIYTSADPRFDSIYGTSKRYDLEKKDFTSLVSTSALVSPGSDRDDPKRVNFVSIQHEHTVACPGYTVAAVRTGYEQVMAHRTGDMFAYTAKQDGRVTNLTENAVTVEYKDGTSKSIEIGRRYGHAGGATIPQTVVANVRLGQKVKEGDVLTYNTGFFEKDFLNPNGVAWKTGVTVTTALMESADTLEDSSTISKRASEWLKTKLTKPRTIVVSFDQSVRKLVKPGDVLSSEDILCIIEDAVSSNNELFDEESIETLRMLGAQAPAAKSKGVVERIEVFYHGDKEDMSDTLRTIANASDRELGKKNRELGLEATTGSVDEAFRVEGEPLALDTMAIRIYITGDVAAGVGDKGVFCNQLKTVFGRVTQDEIKTETGVVVDAIFGQKSIYDRIVNSAFIIGTSTSLLKVISKKMIEAYRK